jgi:hypothetical protein
MVPQPALFPPVPPMSTVDRTEFHVLSRRRVPVPILAERKTADHGENTAGGIGGPPLMSPDLGQARARGCADGVSACHKSIRNPKLRNPAITKATTTIRGIPRRRPSKAGSQVGNIIAVPARKSD